MPRGNSPLINIWLSKKWLIKVLNHVLSWALTVFLYFNLSRIHNQAEAKSKLCSFNLGISWNTSIIKPASCLMRLFLSTCDNLMYCVYLKFDWIHNYLAAESVISLSLWTMFFLSISFVVNKSYTVLVRRTEWISYQFGRHSMIDCSLSVMAECCSKKSSVVCPW